MRVFIIRPICIGILLILSFYDPVSACGSIDDWTSMYNRGEKHKALFYMIDCADNYRAPADDIALLPVIQDSLQNSRQVADMAKIVFRYYNHLWGARKEPGYSSVFKAVTGDDDFNNLTDYQDWMVVTPIGGANMREAPSLESRVITALKYGMPVKAGQKQGEWIKVRPVGPGSVDSRFEGKSGYIHESLLAAY